MSVLLYGCNTSNLHAVQILEAQPHKQQLYGHVPSISQTIQDKQNLLGINGEVRENWLMTFSYGQKCWLTSKDLHLSALFRH